jgi:CRISPR-associated protein Cas6
MDARDAGVVDLAFAIDGGTLPADHDLQLWREIVRCLPRLEAASGAGIHPLKTSPGGEGTVLLARRAKLILRLPAWCAGDAMKLTGSTLSVGSGLAVGPGSERPLRPWATLHAHRVASQAAGDTDFIDEIERWLATREIRCGVITGGRRTRRAGEREIRGWSVVLHDVRDADSLCVQSEGMGAERALGWGIFVPHKSIAAVK